MNEDPRLVKEYQDLLRAIGHGHLLDTTEEAGWDDAIRQLLAEGRRSEEREGTGLGFLQGHNEAELIAALRERLGNRRGLAFPLQVVYRDILNSADEYNYTLPFPILFGEFPTGCFNAQAVRVEAGAFLLVNTGLMMLLYQCATLVAKSFAVSVRDDDTNETRARAEAELTHDELVDRLSDAILAYQLTGSSTCVARTEFDTGLHSLITTLLTQGAERFVVGHEVGHVVAGHLTDARAVRCATRVPEFNLQVVPKSWDQEIEADIYGIRLLVPPSKSTITTVVELQRFSFSVTGPFIFLGLDKLLTNIELRLIGKNDENVLASDHPPAEMRMEAVAMFLERIGAAQAMELPMFVRNWFDDVAQEVCEQVVQRLESM